MTKPAEIEKRIDEIITLFNLGYCTYADVYSYAVEKEWNIGERQIRTYISRAHKKMTDITFMKLGGARKYALSSLLYLQQETLKRKEFGEAFKIVKEIAKIAGAYEPEEKEEEKNIVVKIEHTVSKEELRKRIENDDF